MKMPEWNRRDVAHSCGETCGRNLSKKGCVHRCTLLCHPGSCPQCVAMVTKYCGCGKTSQTLQCSAHKPLLCDSICGKDLPCGKHVCERQCHQGECGSCDKTVQQSNVSQLHILTDSIDIVSIDLIQIACAIRGCNSDCLISCSMFLR